MKAHLAANFQIGDAAEEMIDVEPVRCETCSGWLDPLLGKIVRDGLRWDVWIEGNYEHRSRPETAHIPKVTNGNQH